jgi:hypothetical protein
MIKVFASGSCRLLENIHTGHNRIQPVHSLFYGQPHGEYNGINFMGKLHNTKQNIAFLKLLINEISIPYNILHLFLHTYFIAEPSVEDRLEVLRSEFEKCDIFIFEICSMKLYVKDGWPLLQEQWLEGQTYGIAHQTPEDLMNDLCIIRSLIPKNKPIIFQCHFRLGYIHNNDTIIESRELIYNTIKDFVCKNNNTFIYDPSVLLRAHPEYMINDGVHFDYATYKNEIFEDLMKTISKCFILYNSPKPLIKTPYNHIITDSFFTDNALDNITKYWPDESSPEWNVKLSPENGRKLELQDLSKIPDIRKFIMLTQTDDFVKEIGKLFEIPDLVPDPLFIGGGLNAVPRGGFLRMHADFNYNDQLKLYRRINLIIYMNKMWDNSWKGELCIGNNYKVKPCLNRAVIFEVNDINFHGYPEPIECPNDVYRRGINLYYYSKTPSPNQSREPHKTIWVT